MTQKEGGGGIKISESLNLYLITEAPRTQKKKRRRKEDSHVI